MAPEKKSKKEGAMRNTLDLFRAFLLSAALLIFCVGEVRAGLVGESLSEMGLDEEVQNAGDALYNAASAAVIGGQRGADAGRGITGALGDLTLNSGKITCSLWLIQLRSHFRNLVISGERARAQGADDAEIARLDELIAKTQEFARKLEIACTKVGWLTDPPAEEWKTVNRLKDVLGLGAPAPDEAPSPHPPAPPAPPPLPEGWNMADLHCRNLCSGIFEAYANALAGSRNKYSEADTLRRGELAEAARNETQAQRNLDESRANRKMSASNLRRDERQLAEAKARSAEVQGRIDRITAEAEALAARARELLERLKECVKGCRKQIRDMSGVDASRIDTYFTNQVRDGGSAQDAQRYTTLSGDAADRKSRLSDKSEKADSSKDVRRQSLKDGAPVKEGKSPSSTAAAKDGDPPLKDGRGGPVKPLPDKGGGMQQIDPAPSTRILDSVDAANEFDARNEQESRRVPPAAAPPPAACPDCTAQARRLTEQQAEWQRESAVLDRMRKDYTEATAGQGMDRRVPDDPEVVRAKAVLVAQTEAMIRRQAEKVEGLERAIDVVRRQLEACNRNCTQPSSEQRGTAATSGTTGAAQTGDGQKDARLAPTGGGGCTFPPAKPITIGPREKYGYGGEQKAAETGKAVLGFLGGFLGGRGNLGGGGGGSSPFPGASPGGDKPALADDPIKDKQTFADAPTGTAIKVGGQYRPDGKLLVSVDVDKAEDKGVVHQAVMERLQYLPSGGCAVQQAEPGEWLHYEIWEDWWAKIRIQRYESVDGGPWRKTHDTGWQDWGSGSRMLESGVMSADQIPGTAWGSMGADRAFGGPRSAGAVFDPGKPAVTGAPAAERLVVHVTQPGKDPVTTVPFTLYPTYGTDGKVNYTDQAPDFEALRRSRLPRVSDKMGGGMQQIDPPAAGAASGGSILDSIDSGVGKTPLAK
jgi:hypothetical protein